MLFKLIRNTRGATAIEYALIASLVSIAAIAGYQNLGSGVNAMYTEVEGQL